MKKRMQQLICLLALLWCGRALADSVTITGQSDFQAGLNTNTNSNEPPVGSLKLNDSILTPFDHIWVALSGRDAVARIDTSFVDPDGVVTVADSAAGNGAVFGEYLTRPNGRGGNPSRTTVDEQGNVWLGNRNEAGDVTGLGNRGAITKISANPQGLTSTGIWNGSNFDQLEWSNVGGADSFGGVSTAADSAILQYVRTAGTHVRHMSIDADNNVWAGGGPGSQGGNQAFQLYDGSTGAEIASSLGNTTSFDVNRGGYGGLVDGNGVVWSAGLGTNSLVRFDPATGIAQSIDNGRESYGMGIDGNSKVWISNWQGDSIQRFAADGTLENTFFPAGMNNPRGVAVTGDNNIWVANSFADSVSRLDNDGNLLATVGVGDQPTGVAIDSQGKVWVTNLDSHNVMRIDPATNMVDLTVELGAGSAPYNYSDMTGSVLFGATISQGAWRDVLDAGNENTMWDDILWNTEPEGQIPAGTTLILEGRVSDDQTNWTSYVSYASGDAINLMGRYMELRATFGRDPGVGGTAILSDITVQFTVPEPGTLALLAPGVALLALIIRRRRR